MDESFLYTLGLVKRNTYFLLQSRGIPTRDPDDPITEVSRLYTISKTRGLSLAEAASESFSSGSTGSLSVIFLDRNYDPGKRKEKMIGTDQIKALVSLPEPKLIIAPTKLSPQAKKEAVGLKLFLFDQLLINLPNHIYVFPHRAIAKAATDEYPQISESDPIVQWYGFPKGTVIEITRADGPTYRVVA